MGNVPASSTINPILNQQLRKKFIFQGSQNDTLPPFLRYYKQGYPNKENR